MMGSLDQRPRYRPGLGISWPRLPLLLGGTLVAASATACLLGQFRGLLLEDLPVIPFVLAAGLLALWLMALIRLGHCRNRWLALALGATAGAAAYVGHFLAWYISHPTYYRSPQMDVFLVFLSHVGYGRMTPSKLLIAAAEIVVLVALPAFFAVSATGRAYSATLRRWMRRDMALLPADAPPEFLQALAAGSLRQFAADARPVGEPKLCARLVLEYADVDGAAILDHPVYATLADVPPSRFSMTFAFPRSILRQVALTPDEVRALAPLFPDLDLKLAPADEAQTSTSRLDEAQITPVPEPYRRRVRSGNYAWKVNLLELAPQMVMWVGAIVVVTGGALIHERALLEGVMSAVLGLVL